MFTLAILTIAKININHVGFFTAFKTKLPKRLGTGHFASS